MPEIIVNIDPAGAVKVEAQKVTGAGCAALTRAIEAALGKTTADRKKAEFFQQQGQQQTQR